MNKNSGKKLSQNVKKYILLLAKPLFYMIDATHNLFILNYRIGVEGGAVNEN